MIHLIDLFCGAGGVSTGAAQAGLNVLACVNHDKNAIKSHQKNHPDCLHYTEDMKTLDLSEILSVVEQIRSQDETAIIGLWASLECTNFSKAKGGLPRDADSRTLAEHLFRYIDTITPDIIYIENVEEFMSWGPLDEKGKPISKKKGQSYVRWCNNIQNRGYNFDYRILNAADYGAITSRKRYFAQFAKPNIKIEFPKATHSKKAVSNQGVLIDSNVQKWRAVKPALDLNDHGKSIFGRTKNLSEKTYERIYNGLIKFIANGKENFLIKYNSVNQKTGKYVVPDMENPCPTISTQGRLGVINCQFLSKYFTGNPYSKNISIDAPCGTIKPSDNHAFITTYYSSGSNAHSIDTASPTVTTVDRFRLITSFLMNPQYKSAGSSIDNPCFTLIARMDKMPPSLISPQVGISEITIMPNDSPMMILIKEFMMMYGIADIKSRMLKTTELLKIQGFPENYVLVGTEAEKKKYIGNAVEVNQAKVILETSLKANENAKTIREKTPA